MKITFLGAAEVVTGSNFLLELDNTKLLVDCGMFQGNKEISERNFDDYSFNPADIDYVILTHAHIDHSGRIPQLVKRGFKGKVITTSATADLCSVMLPDSAYIQEMEAEWTNRKRRRAGKPTVEPMYTLADAEEALRYFEGYNYNELIKINADITIRLRNAGHILGSSIIEMWLRDEGKEFKIVFSGDLGNKDSLLMNDPTIIEDADYVVVESTYGNRFHKDTENKALILLDIITDTIEKGGNIVIPSFAIERTQEILYELNQLKESKASKIGNIPVYVDSPLAINATKIFMENIDFLNKDCKELIKHGDNPFEFPNLVFTETAEESIAINSTKGSSIIVSASGMCDAGRIKHHLKHNLWRNESSIVFVGYQANGTLGRRIVEGDKSVKIFGEEISIKSKIYSIEGFSGHADQQRLIEWLGGFKKKPQKVFLVHGEPEALSVYSSLINKELGLDTHIALHGQTINITPTAATHVVKERFHAKKEYTINAIEDVKEKLDITLENLKDYIANNEDIKIDSLYFLVDNIDASLDKIKKEIK